MQVLKGGSQAQTTQDKTFSKLGHPAGCELFENLGKSERPVIKTIVNENVIFSCLGVLQAAIRFNKHGRKD